MTHRIGRLSVFWMLAFMASFCHAQLSVTVDRNQITEAEILRLTIIINNPVQSFNPDFSSVETDFNILSMSGPNRKSSITYINGRNTSVSSVSWELRLHAKRPGRLLIPSFKIGDMVSQPINISVTRQSVNQQRVTQRFVFFETTVDRSETYVQAQIIYTVRLFYVDNISGDFPGPPDVGNSIIEAIENEHRYNTIKYGRGYNVLEKSYAIYPQKSGELTIPREAFSGSKVGRGFFSTREPIMTLSRPHTIKVKPKPVAFTGGQWLPARELLIAESWSEQPPVFKVGEPVNRTLTIIADGLAASLLPPFENIEIAGTKTYRDPPTEEQQTSPNGIVSIRTTIVGIVPTRPGSITIPEIKIPWWNTQTDSLELAVIPESTYTVEGSATDPASISQPLFLPSIPGSGSDKVTIPSSGSTQPAFWMIVSGCLALAWLMTLMLWLRQYHLGSRAPSPADGVQLAHVRDTADLYRRLVSACQKNQPSATQNLLFLWGKAKFPSIDSTRELAGELDSEQLEAEINQLETCLYSPEPDTAWNGKTLLKLLAELNSLTVKKPRKTSLAETLNPVSS